MNKVCASDLTEKMKDTKMKNRVLIVDDSRFALKILRDILTKENYSVVAEARNGNEAIEMAKEHKPDYVFLDVEMPFMDGVSALPKILEVNAPCYIIMCTAMGQQEIIDKSICAGAKDYVLKPYRRENIVGVMNAAAMASMEGQILPFKRSSARNETSNAEVLEGLVDVNETMIGEDIEDKAESDKSVSNAVEFAGADNHAAANVITSIEHEGMVQDHTAEEEEKDVVELPTLDFVDIEYSDANGVMQHAAETMEHGNIGMVTLELTASLEEIGTNSVDEDLARLEEFEYLNEISANVNMALDSGMEADTSYLPDILCEEQSELHIEVEGKSFEEDQQYEKIQQFIEHPELEVLTTLLNEEITGENEAILELIEYAVEEGNEEANKDIAEQQNMAELPSAAEQQNIAELASAAEQQNIAELPSAAEQQNITELVSAAEQQNIAELASAAEQQNIAELPCEEERQNTAEQLEHLLPYAATPVTDNFSNTVGDKELQEKTKRSTREDLRIGRSYQLIRRSQKQNKILVIGTEEALDISCIWNHKLSYYRAARPTCLYTHKWIAYSKIFCLGKGLGDNSKAEEEILTMLIRSCSLKSRCFAQVNVQQMQNWQENRKYSKSGCMNLLEKGRMGEITIGGKYECSSQSTNYYLGKISQAISEILREKL